MNIIEVDIKKIQEREGNPNKMTTKQMNALKLSIQKYGELQPVIIDKNMVLIDGHQRKKAYEELGLKKIPAIALNLEKEEDKLILSQIMNKVKGNHQDDLDAAEFKKILENIGMEDLVIQTAQTEQDILNIINKVDAETKETLEKNQQEMDVTMQREIVCPKCGEKIRINKKNE